jgi:hypothetical protein
MEQCPLLKEHEGRIFQDLENVSKFILQYAYQFSIVDLNVAKALAKQLLRDAAITNQLLRDKASVDREIDGLRRQLAKANADVAQKLGFIDRVFRLSFWCRIKFLFSDSVLGGIQ